MTDEKKKSLTACSPKQISPVIWGAIFAVTYVAVAPITINVIGLWPAPYWFAVGLSGLSIASLICSKWQHLLLGAVLGIVAAIALWYAEHGVYHHLEWKWAYSTPWTYILKFPVYILLGTIFFIGKWGNQVSLVKTGFATGIYFTVYLLLMSQASLFCSVALRRSGTFLHGNVDDFGCRLGAFSLAASFFSTILIRRIYSNRQQVEEEEQKVSVLN